MNCPNCGARILATFRFCGACGHELTAPATGPLPPPVATERVWEPDAGRAGGEAAADDGVAQPSGAATRPRPPWGRTVGLVAGMVAVAAAAVLTIRLLHHDKGGAASPELAVRQVATSVTAGDWLGAADLIVPDEAKGWSTFVARGRKAITNASAGGARTTVAGTGATTAAPTGSAVSSGKAAKANGAQLAVDLTAVTVESLGPDAARVTARGSLRWALASSIDPFVSSAFGAGPSGTIGDARATLHARGGEAVPPELIVVRHSGRWYLSPLLTGAEYARRLLGLPAGDYASLAAKPTSSGRGAADQRAAVQAMADAVAAQDVDALAATLTAPEARAVHVYRAAVLEWLHRRGFTPGSAQFTGMQLRAGPDASTLELTALDGTKTAPDGSTRQLSFDGSCFKATDGTGPCAWLSTDAAKRLGVPRLQLVVTQSGGRWRVSPLASLVKMATTAVGTVDRPLLATVFGTQHLDDATPLDLDVPTPVAFAGRPYAVYDATVAAGERVTWDVRCTGCRYAVFDQATDGSWTARDRAYLGVIGRLAARVGEAPAPAGTEPSVQRLVVTTARSCTSRWRGCFVGDPAQTVTVAARRVASQRVVFPGTAKGSLEPGQAIALQFNVAKASTWKPVLTGGVTAQLSGPVSSLIGSDAPLALKPGDYELLVTNPGATAATFHAGFAEVVVYGFEGGGDLQRDIPATGSVATVLHLHGGHAWELKVTPSAALNVTVSLIDYDGKTVACTSDSAGPGGAEGCSFQPAPRDGDVTVEVAAVGGTAGTATLTYVEH